jgi:hypothetical protein
VIAVPTPPSDPEWKPFAMYWPSNVIAALCTPSLMVNFPEVAVVVGHESAKTTTLRVGSMPTLRVAAPEGRALAAF